MKKILLTVGALLALAMTFVITHPKELPEAEGCGDVCVILPKGTGPKFPEALAVGFCDSQTWGCSYCCSWCVQQGFDYIVGNRSCDCTIAPDYQKVTSCPT